MNVVFRNCQLIGVWLTNPLMFKNDPKSAKYRVRFVFDPKDPENQKAMEAAKDLMNKIIEDNNNSKKPKPVNPLVFEEYENNPDLIVLDAYVKASDRNGNFIPVEELVYFVDPSAKNPLPPSYFRNGDIVNIEVQFRKYDTPNLGLSRRLWAMQFVKRSFVVSFGAVGDPISSEDEDIDSMPNDFETSTPGDF